jgi:hypothetical protein
MPFGIRAVTDGIRIWMSPRLLQRERRSSLAHELEHIRRGHTSCVRAAQEAQVRHHAARWLLPDIHQVADALVWAGGVTDEAAEDLWVDLATLCARVDPTHMHPAEKAIVTRRFNDRD